MDQKVIGLTRFGRMAQSHWEKFRPKMVAHLKQNQVYHEALLNAQEQAAKMIGYEVSRLGNDLENAREKALWMFVLLPSEEEQPIMEADRMPYNQPESIIESGEINRTSHVRGGVMRTVTISQYDDGTIMVGLIPAVGPEEEGAAPEVDDELLLTPDLGMGAQDDMAGTQEVRSVDEALQIARDLLTAPTPEEA